MARWIREEFLGKPDDFVHFIMQDFIRKNGFQQKEMKGEMVWQEGVGMLAPPKFFKYTYSNGVVHIEAWMKTAWLPGVYSGENAMTGFVGLVPKKAYKNSLEEVMRLLHQPLPSDYSGQPAMQGGPAMQGSQAMQGGPAMQGQPSGGPVYVEGVDNSRYATLGLIFSLVSFLGICVPIVGVLFGAMAIIYGKKSMNSGKRSMAVAAIVLGIIGIVVSVILWISSAVILFGNIGNI